MTNGEREEGNQGVLVDLPGPLRTVFGSPTKAELLRLIDQHGPIDAGALIDRLSAPMHRNSVNAHLNALAELGWITVNSVRQNRGGFARVWDLTSRDVSWADFLAMTRERAPQPALA